MYVSLIRTSTLKIITSLISFLLVQSINEEWLVGSYLQIIRETQTDIHVNIESRQFAKHYTTMCKGEVSCMWRQQIGKSRAINLSTF